MNKKSIAVLLTMILIISGALPVLASEPEELKGEENTEAYTEAYTEETVTEESTEELPEENDVHKEQEEATENNEPVTEEAATEENIPKEEKSSEEEPVEDEVKDVMSLYAWQDGSYIVIEYKTKHTDPWDYCYQNHPIDIDYSDGSYEQIVFEWNGEGIHGQYWSNIEGYSIEKTSDQADTETAIIRIPSSWFNTLEFTMSGGGYETSLNAEPPVEDEPKDVVYKGIRIDGDFSDWDAVEKFEVIEPDGDHNIECAAWVIEDDYVYIYIKDTGTDSATWAGPAHNGKFAITTDLGRTLLLQLNRDGMITGAEGIDSVHKGSQWEASIPASLIPQNNGGLSFGLYHCDASSEGQAPAGNVGEEDGITYDALYGDWDSYPHTEIYYSGAGTQNNVPDGEAAVYADDKLYGHCVTMMPEHLNERGGEFTQGVNVVVNDDWSWNRALQMRLATADSEGNLDWNPQKENLEDGTYEYYIFGTDAWGSSRNLGDLVAADVCYGKLAVTIKEGRHDAEWYIDLDKLAKRNGLEETDIKTISVQYLRIGNDVVTTAGTPTGTGGSAFLMFMAVAIPAVLRKRILI